jgi:sigma-B regulation protein RsbU (phosphoserine phosphatase)
VSRRSGPPNFEALFHEAPCGYLLTDATGTIVLANRTLLGWLAYEEDEVVGRKRLTDLLTGGGRIYHETHYRPALELHGEVHEIALELVRADGERVPVLLNSAVSPAGTEDGWVRTAVFKATDRRAYELEVLHQRERAEASEQRALETAQTLQRLLIPPPPPAIEGLDIGAAFRPAGDGSMIGGDFYDVFEFESADWLVGIGDVCGKGVEAASVAGLVRFSLRAAAVRTERLDDVVHAVNRALLDADTDDRFCTLLLTRFSCATGSWQASICSGGHPLPLLLCPGEEPVHVGEPGELVGIFPDPSYHHVEVPLDPGCVMVMYTDGVTEGRHAGELYGEERLLELVAAGRDDKPAELAAALVDDVLRFQEGVASDDVAVVVARSA